jgi:hypothetical protein
MTSAFNTPNKTVIAALVCGVSGAAGSRMAAADGANTGPLAESCMR